MTENQEIEVKILNIDKQTIENRLGELGAVPTGTERLTDSYYKSPLFPEYKLRIRQIRSNGVLTLKGAPKDDHVFHIRSEIETRVEDPYKTAEILTCLGFKKTEHREKIRTSYVLNGTHIVIDEYPRLQPLLEIEGDEKHITQIVESLGYTMKDTFGKDWKKQFPEYDFSDCKFEQ